MKTPIKIITLLAGLTLLGLIISADGEEGKIQSNVKKAWLDGDTLYTVDIKDKIEHESVKHLGKIPLLRVIKLDEQGTGIQYRIPQYVWTGAARNHGEVYDFADGMVICLDNGLYIPKMLAEVFPDEELPSLRRYRFDKMDKYYMGITIDERGKIVYHSTDKYGNLSKEERNKMREEDRQEIAYSTLDVWGKYPEIFVRGGIKGKGVLAYSDIIALNSTDVLVLLQIVWEDREKIIDVWIFNGTKDKQKQDVWTKEYSFSVPVVGHFKAVQSEGTLYLFFAEGIFSVNIAEAKGTKDKPLAAKEHSKIPINTIVHDKESEQIYLSGEGEVYNIKDLSKAVPIPEIDPKLKGEEVQVAKWKAVVKAAKSLQEK